MKGMRGKFTKKRGAIRQKPNGRIVRLMAGLNGSLNGVWRFK